MGANWSRLGRVAGGAAVAALAPLACGDEAEVSRVGRDAEREAGVARQSGTPYLPPEHYYGQRVSAGSTFTWSLAGAGNVCLVSQHLASADPLAEVTCRNHAEYARVHDYPYTRLRGAGAEADGRVPAPGWQKYLALAQALGAAPRGAAACRWAVWVDVHVLFTHLERPLAEVLLPFEDREANPYGLDRNVVLARREDGAPGRPFALAAVAVRAGPAGHAFLADLLGQQEAYAKSAHGDEDALRDWALARPVGTPAPGEKWERLAPGLRDGVGAVRQRVFAGFFGHGVVDGHGGSWRDGDLAVHLQAPSQHAARQLAMGVLADLARPRGQRSPRRLRPPEDG